MYTNIGKKIKVFAYVLLIIGIVTSGLYCFGVFSWKSGWSFIAFAISVFLTWMVTCLIYGFGELIDRAGTTNANLEDLKEIIAKKNL